VGAQRFSNKIAAEGIALASGRVRRAVSCAILATLAFALASTPASAEF
jgi:hypothetical protein